MFRPIRRLSVLLAAVTALAASAGALAFTPPPFPRIAGIQMGGAANYSDPAYQAQLAKQSVMVLKYYPGYAPGGGSMESDVEAIKALNPDSLVFVYVESDNRPIASPGAWSTLVDKMNSMKWWLYKDGSLKSPVPSLNSKTVFTINNTPSTSKDSNGDDSINWMTKYFVKTIYGPNPAIDGFFMDNVFVRPNVAGDWGRNGTVLQPSSSQAAADLQQGYARYFSLVRQLMPGKYQIANVGEWGKSEPIPAAYQGMANGGVMEAMIGKSYSVENYAGWQAMMTRYDAIMNAFLAPKIGIFNQWGSATDYQSMRYGLASCLMNDGYYSFTRNSTGYSGVVWFDEYNANLGSAVSSPPTSAWQKGVWRREFTNGIALVNPKGNGTQTVTLGGTFVKIKGTQDPSVNSGQKVTQVTLKDRDGIILLRQSPIQQPKAPTGVTAQP